MPRTYDDATRVGPRERPCSDGERGHRLDQLEIEAYRGNHSAFNGYRFTPSDYSRIRCTSCGEVWRTNAVWVDRLPRRGTLAQQHATYDLMIDERIVARETGDRLGEPDHDPWIDDRRADV